MLTHVASSPEWFLPSKGLTKQADVRVLLLLTKHSGGHDEHAHSNAAASTHVGQVKAHIHGVRDGVQPQPAHDGTLLVSGHSANSVNKQASALFQPATKSCTCR